MLDDEFREDLESFMSAVQDGNTGQVSLILSRHGMSIVNETDCDGCTALMWAAKGGHKEVFSTLLRFGASIEATDRDGCTSLILAAKEGYSDLVLMLLGAGANVEARDDSGRTALMWATSFRRNEVVRILVEAGAHIEVTDHRGQTLLMIASASGHHTLVSTLLSTNVDVLALDNDGRSVISYALPMSARFGQADVIYLLLQSILNSISDFQIREKNRKQLIEDIWKTLFKSSINHQRVSELSYRILRLLMANSGAYAFDVFNRVKRAKGEKAKFKILFYVLGECVNTRETVDMVCCHFGSAFLRGRANGIDFMKQALLEALGECEVSRVIGLLRKYMYGNGMKVAIDALREVGGYQILTRLLTFFDHKTDVTDFVNYFNAMRQRWI